MDENAYKDIDDIYYSIEELKSGALTRSEMLADFQAISLYLNGIIDDLSNGLLDGETLVEVTAVLSNKCEEMYLNIGYCYENDCFGGA